MLVLSKSSRPRPILILKFGLGCATIRTLHQSSAPPRRPGGGSRRSRIPWWSRTTPRRPSLGWPQRVHSSRPTTTASSLHRARRLHRPRVAHKPHKLPPSIQSRQRASWRRRQPPICCGSTLWASRSNHAQRHHSTLQRRSSMLEVWRICSAARCIQPRPSLLCLQPRPTPPRLPPPTPPQLHIRALGRPSPWVPPSAPPCPSVLPLFPSAPPCPSAPLFHSAPRCPSAPLFH